MNIQMKNALLSKDLKLNNYKCLIKDRIRTTNSYHCILLEDLMPIDTIVSYDTIIGYKNNILNKWYFTDKFYSRTTSRHRNESMVNYCGEIIDHDKFVKEFNNYYYGTYNRITRA